MFGWLRSLVVPSARLVWTTSSAHLLLLSRFRRGDLPRRYTSGGWVDMWSDALGERPQTAIARFVATGVLEPAPLSDALGCLLKVDGLRRVLRELGLKGYGAK